MGHGEKFARRRNKFSQKICVCEKDTRWANCTEDFFGLFKKNIIPIIFIFLFTNLFFHYCKMWPSFIYKEGACKA